MKNKIYKIVFALLLSFFTACGGGDSNSDNNEIRSRNFTLNPNESVICTSLTTFIVTPSPSPNEPDVTLIQDAQNGDTTISVDADSKGYVTIEECSKK